MVEGKEAEKASVLQALLDAAPDATVTVDVSGRILKVNHQAETLFGYPGTELLGRPIDIVLPERFNQCHENRHALYQTGPRARAKEFGPNLSIHRKDGSEVPVEISCNSADLGDGQRVTIIAFRNAAERTQVEEALVASETQMKLFMEATTDCIWNWDLTTGHVERSVGFQRRFGYAEEEIVPIIDWWFERLYPDDRDRVRAFYENAIASGRSTCSYEYRFRCRDGSYATVSDRASIIRNDSGQPVRALGAMTDITESVRAEEALRESRQHLEAILNNSPALIFLKDLEGRYLLVNREFEKVFHLTCQDILGKTDADIFSPPQAAVFRANDIKVLQANAPLKYEETALHDDGPHTSIVFKFPLRDATWTPYAIGGIATDITDRKQMEQALRGSEEALRQVLEEREHLLLDLHDNIIQTLCVLGMGLEECQYVLQEDPAAAKQHLVNAIAGLNGVIRDVRGHLHSEAIDAPSNLEYLQKELASLMQMVKDVQGPQLHMTVKESALTDLSEDVTRHVISIIREGVSNCLKHAGASTISVSLQEHGPALRLAIKDDGVGFGPESRLRSNGHGLDNIAARTKQIGGTLQVISQPMHGTHILVDFPGGNSDVLV